MQDKCLLMNLVMVYIASSMNPDQIAPRSTLWSVFMLFNMAERIVAAGSLERL